ncbi:hypothetical protein [Streptosporangium sp. NPDC023615]|uniref:hypothetical protein n=1 Tax=Streptosporangium sp. NPDC023615 TaxID=3154794 RepID=UPI00342B0A15
MSILIVGGSGHLGRRLVRLARAGGQTVTATYATRRPPDGDGVRWLPVDLRPRWTSVWTAPARRSG